MHLLPSTLRGLLVLMGAASLLPLTTASASDRVRIPLPPPPGEVIREVRGFIHGIGRGIKRAGQRIISESEERSAPPPPRRDFGPSEEWDGEFYPDEYDRPDVNRQYRRTDPPRDGSDRWQREERLRREQASREGARDYRLSDPAPNTSPTPRTEQFRAPAPAPSPPDKGSVKESAAAPTVPKNTPPSEVQYAAPVPGKKGLVYPPGVEKKPENMVDVGDFQPGQLVRNPRTGELFRVP